jgi:hypothetical protein
VRRDVDALTESVRAGKIPVPYAAL